MTSNEQLVLWLKGESVHRDGPGSECCPDFSCCMPALKWPEHVRRRFVEGTERDRTAMCMFSLNKAMEYAERRKVRVVGDEQVDGIADYDALLARLDAIALRCERCRGHGFVPVRADHHESVYRNLWQAAEAKSLSDDGYHFVTCQDCGGDGKAHVPTQKEEA